MSLMDQLANAKDMITALSSIDEKRLKLFNSILEKVVSLTANTALTADPDGLNKVLELLRMLSNMPLENLREIHGTVDGLEKALKNVPSELVSLAKDLAQKTP